VRLRWFRDVGEATEIIKHTYRLNDEHVKLIDTRLRGKALKWLHSKFEFIETFLKILLVELKSMFHYRFIKIILRKKFKKHEWKKGETFNDYVYEKVILGNCVPIEEDRQIHHRRYFWSDAKRSLASYDKKWYW